MGGERLWYDHQLRGGHSPVDLLNEYPRPDGVGHGSEGGPLVLAPGHLLLLGEGASQPLPHLLRNSLAFKLRQIRCISAKRNVLLKCFQTAFCLLFRISDDTRQNIRHILQVCYNIVHIDGL